eukprot:6224749-Lingulodinium_polyedra.AAC.1
MPKHAQEARAVRHDVGVRAFARHDGGSVAPELVVAQHQDADDARPLVVRLAAVLLDIAVVQADDRVGVRRAQVLGASSVLRAHAPGRGAHPAP